jgi:hypothetical protein
LHREIAQRGLDRQSFAVIVGGGAVQDMAGFAAATAHRGVRVVRLPTTVLSQNDSGVGVKNGVNAFGLKNFVGTFAPPFAVINDARFLETLERRDRLAGIAEAVKVELSHVMEGFGYGILKALVTDIEPDARVKEAMNEINAAQRMRVAANEKGEAERILKVKLAEGDAQSKALQGKGIADQRQAIVAGLRDSVDEFQRSVPGTTAKDVMNLVLMTQYFDMLKEIGASTRSTAILIPHSPGHLSSLTEQIRNAMIEADQISGADQAPSGNGHVPSLLAEPARPHSPAR